MHFRPEIHTESSTPVHRAWHYARGTIEAPPNANAERLLLTGIEAYIKERVDAVLRSRLATAGRGEQKSVPSSAQADPLAFSAEQRIPFPSSKT